MIRNVSTALWLISALTCSAYEVDTHAKITGAAVDASHLVVVLQSLNESTDSVFNTAEIKESDVNKGNAKGWLREGAIREDGGWCNPRPRNHFYNPLNNSGFSYKGFVGIPSADWGLDDSGNDFSYKRAKESFWEALTASTDDTRQQALANTFRSLGQVVHLIQDAAQPQHVRNDSHAGISCPLTLGQMGPASAYELHTNRVDGLLQYSGYPIVTLPKPRDYWDDESGRGMAEFSNRNFVTRGTNFHGNPESLQPAPGFPSPNGSGAVLEDHDIQELLPGSSLHGTMTFIGTWYDDRYAANTSALNPRTSTYSILTWDLKRRTLTPEFTLNRFNFDAAAAILIPRAVGYSAGLIDYFFRGRIEIQAPDRFAYAIANYEGGNGKFTRVDLKLKNASEGTRLGTGKIRAVVRYRHAYLEPLVDPRWGIDDFFSFALSAEQDVSLTEELKAVTFDFTDSPIPMDAADVSIAVAFRGPLITDAYTENDGIAFGGKDLFEPDLVDVVNSGDYECAQNVLNYTPGQWRLDGSYLRAGPANQYFEASSQNWNFASTSLTAPQYVRVAVIQDQDQYTTAQTIESALDVPSGYHFFWQSWKTCPASINRVVQDDNGQKRHEYRWLGSSTFRGSTGVKRFLFSSPSLASSQTCVDALAGKTPAIQELPASINEEPQS